MNHLLQEVYRLLVEVLTQLSNVICGGTVPLRERHFHFGKICEALPCLFIWSAHGSENLEDLPDF